MEYETAFDLLEVGYRQWTFPAFGLIFIVIGAVLIIFRRATSGEPRGRWSRVQPYVFFGFACIWTLVSFADTYAEYWGMRRALETGRFITVEGQVSDFIPMPVTGYAMESFRVGGSPLLVLGLCRYLWLQQYTVAWKTDTRRPACTDYRCRRRDCATRNRAMRPIGSTKHTGEPRATSTPLGGQLKTGH